MDLPTHTPWRGSLLPLGCAAAPKPEFAVYQADRVGCLGTASRSSGSKLPRHKSCPITKNSCQRFQDRSPASSSPTAFAMLARPASHRLSRIWHKLSHPLYRKRHIPPPFVRPTPPKVLIYGPRKAMAQPLL
nr:hypothetical protein C1892_15410 [Pseudomonas sp. MPBD7-1]